MEKQEQVKNQIYVSPYGKIKVYWDDKPENYSKEARNRVKKYFSKKYGVHTQNINVVYRPVKVNKKGETIQIDGATIDNIMSIPYQRELFKEWLTRENKDVDFARIISLDDKVNAELDVDLGEKIHRKYKLRWLMVNNFLSYGEGNYFPVDKFNGFTVVNSNPANQGGKTTLTIDAVKFLFFGKTTKTDKNEDVFNQFNEEKDLIVRGLIEIEGEEDIIIERHLTRTAKRKGGWNIKNKLAYYQIMPDGEEVEMNDEDAKKTTQVIKDTVGTESDFDLVVLATSKTLDNLVDSSASESGKLLSRFIGLEVIALKEAAARKMHNAYAKTMKSNLYDTETLKEEIETHEANLVTLGEEDKIAKESLQTQKDEQKKQNDAKIKLIESKEKIDAEILTLNPTTLEANIKTITDKGVNIASNIKELEKQITEIGEIKFDEDRDFALGKEKTELSNQIAVKKSEIARLKGVIEELIKGGICQACNRKLDDVDNTKHIEEHQNQIDTLTIELGAIERNLATVEAEIAKLAGEKAKMTNKNNLELQKDRIEVELEGLRTKLKSKKADLKKYNENIEAIDKNRAIDADITAVDTKIAVCENQKDIFTSKIQQIAIKVDSNTKDIALKSKLIETIKKEAEVDKLFKIYVEMVGKKGISKLVLRSVLPIINGELQRLLEDITDFEVEVYIDDKNEVRFLLVKDGIEKPLKSGSGFELTAASIALRCVLGKMSSLPTPNFITFDEVLGRVAPENVPKMKPLFERVTDMFDIVFFITQITEVKDWANKIITVNKVDNISKIKVN